MLYIFGGRDRDVCFQHEREFILHLHLFFLLTLGPPLPKALRGHSMLEIHGDAYIFGGKDNGNNYNSAIYQLTCSSGICSWSTLNQELKVAREYTVAIRVPDNLCLCGGNTWGIGDGYCDDINNNMNCNYDGGDCCGGIIHPYYCTVIYNYTF